MIKIKNRRKKERIGNNERKKKERKKERKSKIKETGTKKVNNLPYYLPTARKRNVISLKKIIRIPPRNENR